MGIILKNETKEYLIEKKQVQLDELFQYLSIPSISALPEHNEDIKQGAKWTAESLMRIGFDKPNCCCFRPNLKPPCRANGLWSS